MKTKSFIALALSLAFGTSVAFGSSFGDMAENLSTPTEIVTQVALIFCYVIGAILVFAALAQYKIHRQNPKLVPLTTPILLLVLGVIAALIPLGSKMFDDTYSVVERSKAEGKHQSQSTLPLPDLSNKGPRIPHPTQTPDESPSSDANNPPPSSAPSGSEGGFWGSDPRYSQ